MTYDEREPDDVHPGRPSAVPLTERLALSIDEAAELLGVSRDLVYDLVNRHELPAVRLGRRLVVPRRALEEALLALAADDQ